MKKNANSEDVVKDLAKTGIIVIKLVKGEKPEDDKLKSVVYMGTDKLSELAKFEDTDLNKIVNESISKLMNEGLIVDDIDITYRHELISEIVSQEVQADRSRTVNEIKSMKTDYESMKSNSLIDLSEDQLAQIDYSIKTIDKIVNKLTGGE